MKASLILSAIAYSLHMCVLLSRLYSHQSFTNHALRFGGSQRESLPSSWPLPEISKQTIPSQPQISPFLFLCVKSTPSTQPLSCGSQSYPQIPFLTKATLLQMLSHFLI
ncbi:hypothetical protein GQ457_07G011450 [Hibiscus cannabinus]